MSEQYFLDQSWFTNQNIQLNIGNVLVVYTDDGPSGICGQSMDVTSPHTYILIYENEDKFRADKEHIGRRGKNSKIRFVVIGEWSNQGSFILATK